jgi:hypothetical protein
MWIFKPLFLSDEDEENINNNFYSESLSDGVTRLTATACTYFHQQVLTEFSVAFFEY